jgi:hypothetical protein
MDAQGMRRESEEPWRPVSAERLLACYRTGVTSTMLSWTCILSSDKLLKMQCAGQVWKLTGIASLLTGVAKNVDSMEVGMSCAGLPAQAGDNDGSFFTRKMTQQELKEQSESVSAM